MNRLYPLFSFSLIPLLFMLALPAQAASLLVGVSLLDANTVTVQVKNADPRTLIQLQYSNTYGGVQMLPIGTTDTDGTLYTQVPTPANHIPWGGVVQVIEASGAASTNVRWPFSGSTNITLSSNAITVPVGQNSSVSITNPAAETLTISNTAPAAVRATLAGNSVDLQGLQNGAATLTICGGGSDCQKLAVTVGTGGALANALQLSQTAPVVIQGNTASVYISGPAYAYYVSSNSNPSVAQVSSLQNLLTIVGNAPGEALVQVCSPQGACSTLDVNVVPAPPTSNQTLVVNPSELSVVVGQIGTALIADTVSVGATSSAPAIASTTLLGNTHLQVQGVAVGAARIQICDTNNQCAYVQVNVSPAPVVQTPPSVSSGTFTSYLARGMQGAQVTALQHVLIELGYLRGTPNGVFGPNTEAAVRAFQASKGLATLGVVGPSTRAALNAVVAAGSIRSSAASGTTTPSAGIRRARRMRRTIRSRVFFQSVPQVQK